MAIHDSTSFALRIVLAAGIFVLAASSAALAQGRPENRGTSGAPGLNRDMLPDAANPTPGRNGRGEDDDSGDGEEDSDDGASLGRTVVLSGLGANEPQSFLRFSNLGNAAGTALVTLFDPQSGAEVATWEGPSIPGRGAIQVPLRDVVGTARPQTGKNYVAVVRGAFKGQVQHVAWSAANDTVSDLTACRQLQSPDTSLGYVSGPAAPDLDGQVRIVNAGTEARTVTLALHSAATGSVLGTWTSPRIAGKGAFGIRVTDLAAAAVAPVPADTSALTVRVEGSAANMSLSYVEGIDGGAVTDLTAGCALRGGMSEESDDEDEEDEDEDEDDDRGS